jgi:hypothetical protein
MLLKLIDFNMHSTLWLGLMGDNEQILPDFARIEHYGVLEYRHISFLHV